ncbi:MAG: TetR family transcriptional regulator [Candidatus Elarobacter sp.]
MPRPAGGTRSALLDAALDAFAAKGFAGASIREITRVVGVRESAFYAHFSSKRAAYDELFAEGGPPVAARALDTLSSEIAPQEFLSRFATIVVDAWSTPRARKFAAMLMRDAFDAEAQGWHAIRAAIYGVIELLVKRFHLWQSDGSVRSDIAAETLAFEFIAPIAMARFIYFNIAAGKAEGARGRQLIKEHAAAFLTMTAPRPAGKELA